MIIVIESSGVRVDSPSDVTRFHVQAPVGVDVDDALRRSGFGHLDGGSEEGDGDAQVSIAAIRAAVVGHIDPVVWSQQFDGMLGYARSKGWLDDIGEHIRGHIERA